MSTGCLLDRLEDEDEEEEECDRPARSNRESGDTKDDAWELLCSSSILRSRCSIITKEMVKPHSRRNILRVKAAAYLLDFTLILGREPLELTSRALQLLWHHQVTMNENVSFLATL